jgi:cellulose synthase/poly-beta-1,6-N-acetylglucosamine synthase-like glycosyltransferase
MENLLSMSRQNPHHNLESGKPVLSIVVPSYNSGRFITRCLVSVFRELANPHDVEVIVVDNLSTDQTEETLRTFSSPNLVVIRERDNGQSDALNKGFAVAKGEWLCWLNADDEFVPGALPYVIAALRSADHVNWMSGSMVWMDVDGMIVRCAPNMPAGALLRGLGIANVGGPSSFFRDSLLQRAGEFATNLHFCMDTEMWYRFQRLGERCLPIGAYVWAFRVHEHSKTSHVVLTAKRSPEMTAELDLMTNQYMSPLSRYCSPLAPWIWRAKGILSGRDWKAFRDTRRYGGRRLEEMTATG